MTYPKSVASHLVTYPEAFATARGLEIVNKAGRTELLISLRGLDERHPDLVARNLGAVEPSSLVAKVDDTDYTPLPASQEDAQETKDKEEVLEDQPKEEKPTEAPKRGRKPKAETKVEESGDREEEKKDAE